MASPPPNYLAKTHKRARFCMIEKGYASPDGRHRRPTAGRARQSAEALAPRGRASGGRRADGRIRRLAQARLVWAGRARARDPARGSAVALFDGSSLGKIEVIGPDAAALADFHSCNRLSTLKVGRIRYGFVS
jgi:hypothetical protein